ncbi:serine/threonine-protein kinase PknK [Mycobacterium kansasii]|uniref:serine/threonine-protein kinase n=1 Tax=Mycobacterium kansasii TaxID=1768 RepID=UPI000CDE03B2|nr:serine/threonine-protein kinase [Mycobacterium kansasii]POY02491.1 serine/threonine-protein kinase PknK [Mycobacterium kansasii]POY28138.1 serine/threonine-protein kinase PknK [Mycobacterium kansasii]POY32082.1 serine/threonine-protein kinase PknK [Mycobacterium kansasii]
MVDVDSHPTQRGLVPDIPAELREAGFDEVAEIGHGGFGVVYRCAQPLLDRTVAVKVLTTDLDPENLERFLREQHAMGKLSGHPNIVTILQVGSTVSGRPFIVMPYHAKNSLESLIRRHGPLDWVETLRMGVKLAGALEAAHRAGILHRDVKPANILLTEYGEPELTDFGIARMSGGFQTATGIITGSPAFTAPEVLEGKAPTPASDLYSLGATLFCALTGHAAFERRSGEKVVAQFLRITSQPVPDLREHGLPADVAAVIERAMARDPAARPPGAAAFGNELREVQRISGVAVDEMALPVDLGVERRTSPVAPSAVRRDTGATPTPPTPTTKYRPPVPTRSLVVRNRLLDVVRAGGLRRLVLIHAPSGFGKSTLAAQWREELSRAPVGVGWLTIDDDDNNVVWFLAHLLESIRQVRPALAASLGQVLDEHGDDAARYVLTALIDEIHQNDDRLVVVIDDWHRVSDTQTIGALGFLLERGCHHLQAVVTSWSRAGLPVSKLRIRDELVEIDCEALRFDFDEARSLLNDVDGLLLPDGDVRALTTSTDGWVAALQLAALSLRGGADAASLVSRMSGASEMIGDFLAENVLDSLEPELLEFLLATSITERTCGGLASALAAVPRGQAMLEDVEQRGLFLQRIDKDPNWFRYHHLFAEFLRHRLERDHPDRVYQLHRVAADWFAEHDHLNEAVDHALASGDAARAVDLVEQDETNLLEQSKMTTLLEIVKKLPPRMVVSRARLQLTLAWTNVLLQRLAPAAAALKSFETALDRADLSDVTRADLRVEADVLRAVGEVFADRVDAIDHLVAEALARPDSFHPRVGGVAGSLAAFAAVHRFEFDAANRLLAWAEPYQEMMGPFAGVYAHCFGGIAARYTLDIPGALKNFREAYELGATAGPHSYAARLASALLGELLCQTGELAEATRLVDEGYQLESEGAGVDIMIARYVTGARVKAKQGDRDAAIDRLTDGMAAAERLRLPRLAAAVNNERIRLGIAIPQEVAVRLRATRTIRRPPRCDGIATIIAELDEDSGIRLLSASDSADDQEQACRRAAELLAGIDGAQRPWAALGAQLLLVETLRATGKIDEANSLAPAVVARCREHGLSGLLTDAGLG